MQKNIAALFAVFAMTFALVSCGDSKSDDEPEFVPVLSCTSSSITEGAVVDADQTPSITLKFNNLITLQSAQQITLNGKAVSTPIADVMSLTIPLSLQPGTDYSLAVAKGAVSIASKPEVTNEAFTLNFKTVKSQTADPSLIAAAPVNNKATAEAKALYNTLRENYGKKMYSGAMGGVAWETDYTDFLQSQIGAYPAVVGFDYGHLAASPANWINYGDITPVKRVHDKGCIVQIQWHWNVPKSEGSTDLSFYSDKNKFNPANVLVDGSWENSVAVADVDKLAGYLKLLQDAGIPVLWRPFHEAAGDYKWGAWFWWGTKGTEVTKKLYHWLYDKLTNEYGLNNLLWVWTVCTSSEGKPAALDVMQAAYPGDEYVDIVGPDIYPDAVMTDQTAQFRLVNSVVDGRKMVALTECGNLIDPTKAYANKALWSYFMQWYDLDGSYGFHNYEGPDQWIKTIESPYVISIR